MVSDLSPSETIELAELIISGSFDEDGNRMPISVALQIIEETEAFELSLHPRIYLQHLRFFHAYMAHGELVPKSVIKEQVVEGVKAFCSDMRSRGYEFKHIRTTNLRFVLTFTYALILGCCLGFIIAHYLNHTL